MIDVEIRDRFGSQETKLPAVPRLGDYVDVYATKDAPGLYGEVTCVLWVLLPDNATLKAVLYLDGAS